MAGHPRKLIRDKVAELLGREVDGQHLTAAGGRIYNSRDIPTSFNSMPVVLVYTAADEVDPDYNLDVDDPFSSPRRRMMELRVECYDMGGEAAAGVDELAEQVEAIANGYPTLESLVESFRLRRTETDFAEQGDDALFVSIMQFDVVYWTQLQPQDNLPPLELMVGFDPETGPGNEGKYYSQHGGDDV